MPKRVSISEIMHLTGLSRATIDRALNGRGGIHPRTEQVIREALATLSDSARTDNPNVRQHPVSVDFVLRLGRGLASQLMEIGKQLGQPTNIIDMHQKNDDEIYEAVSATCKDIDKPLVLTAKRNERLHGLLVDARKRGKRVITLVSDLPHEARDAFVGIDNRMAGQTAAYLIGNLLRERSEAVVGVVLGDYAFTCHEDREIGFRSHLRTHFPNIRLAEVVKGEDSPSQTFEAVSNLLKENPGIAAIYNVAGGNQGLAQALRERNRVGNICVITHEANKITVPLLRDDILQYLLAQNPGDLLSEATALAVSQTISKEQYLLDFALYTRFNLPRFGVEAARQP